MCVSVCLCVFKLKASKHQQSNYTPNRTVNAQRICWLMPNTVDTYDTLQAGKIRS